MKVSAGKEETEQTGMMGHTEALIHLPSFSSEILLGSFSDLLCLLYSIKLLSCISRVLIVSSVSPPTIFMMGSPRTPGRRWLSLLCVLPRAHCLAPEVFSTPCIAASPSRVVCALHLSWNLPCKASNWIPWKAGPCLGIIRRLFGGFCSVLSHFFISFTFN